MASVAYVQMSYESIASYSASKLAMVTTTRQIAIDHAHHRVHCNVIVPGWKPSHFSRGLGEPDDIVGPAVLPASDDAKWVTGVGFAPVGGFTAR